MMMMRLPIVLLLGLPAGLAAAEDDAKPSLEEPRAGWRDTGDEPASFLQPVRYPASSVTSSEAAAGALIRGHIGSAAKGEATLVVNGLTMPVDVQEDGSFSRPYSFTKGSNSVEVRAPGQAPLRRQLYDILSGRPRVKLRVLLSWDTDGTDVDLHVVAPTGEHTFYGERVSASGGALDVDVTTGFGPEIYAHPNPAAGIYHVYVNYFGAGEVRDDLTVAQVAILVNEGTLAEKRQSFVVPLRAPGDLTLVHSFVYP